MSRQQSYQYDREITIEGRPSRLLIDVQLNYNDSNKVDYWEVRIYLEPPSGPPYESPELPISAPLTFKYVFRNHLYIRGTISLRQANFNVLVLANVTFGTHEDLPHFFEGAIMQVPGTLATSGSLHAPPADIQEPNEDIAEEPNQEMESEPEDLELDGSGVVVLPPDQPIVAIEPADVESLHSGDADLFPYVYMRNWPAPDPELLKLEFTRYPYPLDAPLTGAYLQGLYTSSQSKAADARADMESASVAYIDGRVGADAPFVRNIDELGAPISTYPRIYQLLAQCGQRADDGAESESSNVIDDIWNSLDIPRADVVKYLSSQAHIADMVRVWQSYFALVIKLGYAPRDREQLTQVLIVEHALLRLLEPTSILPSIDELAALGKTVVTLPDAIFPLPPVSSAASVDSPPTAIPAASSTAEDPSIAVYAIGDLQMVKQRLRGYQLGELANVESIQAGEQRESVRREKQQTQTSTTQTRVEGAGQDQQKQTTASSLSNAVLGELASTTSATNYQNFSTSYGPPTTATLNGGWTAEHKPSGPPSRQDVTRFARDILSRTVNRMTREVTEMRTISALDESESTITSLVDNRAGKSNRRAPYYWLNKVYDAYVVNYGNRMIIEMIVAQPAARLLQKARNPTSIASEQPAPPATLGIDSYEDITEHNFPMLVARYPGSDMPMPPEPQKILSLTLRAGEQRALTLPDGYQAVSASLAYAVPLELSSITIQGIIGQTPFQHDEPANSPTTGTHTFQLNSETGDLAVAIDSTQLLSLSPPEVATGELLVTLNVVTQPSAYTMDEWRLHVFQAIHRTYTDLLKSWRNRDTAPVVGMPTGPADHRTGLGASARLRTIERQELKNAAIDLLFVNTYHRIGGDMPSTLSGPSTDMGLAEPRYMYFFESSFEWADMSYSFMGQKSSPDDLAATALAHAAGDQRFQRFLDAAYARLLVPVNLAHAPAVLYQLATGAIWDGSPGFIATTESDVHIRADLVTLSPDQARIERVSEPWNVVVPTGIAVLGDDDLPVAFPGEQSQGLLSA